MRYPRQNTTEEELLKRLRDEPPETWLRPMDLGGFDGSNHSTLLRQLAARGQVERTRRNTIANDRLRSHRVVPLRANPNGMGAVFGATELTPERAGSRDSRGSWVYRLKRNT